jgi:Leucine-rich repeat (LRR) protein
MPVASASKAPWNEIVTPSPSKLITQLPESTSVPISGTIPYPFEFSTVFPQSSSPSPPAITVIPITSESSGSPTIMTTTKRPHPTIHDVVLNAINQGNSTGLNVDLLDEDSAQKAIQWLIATEAASVVTSTDTMNADLMVAMFALAYFYYETSVEKSLGTSRWLQSADICSWEGITCKFYETTNDFTASMTARDQLRMNQTTDNTTGLAFTTTTTVSELNLSGRNLTGQLPSFLALLKDLEVLDLSKNSFTGEIPTSIWSLSHLRELSLWKNNFIGTISPLVSGLSKLEELHLDSNKLSGTIPTELFSLPNLTMFSAYSNKLKGSIPSEIGKLDKLETLWLSSNELSFSIPTEVGALQSLHNLYLDDNYLIGSIPGTIITCSELADVRLNTNFLSGSVSSFIGNLTNLRILYLDGNNLSGRIPTSLGQAINLGKSYRRECNPLLAHR